MAKSGYAGCARQANLGLCSGTGICGRNRLIGEMRWKATGRNERRRDVLGTWLENKRKTRRSKVMQETFEWVWRKGFLGVVKSRTIGRRSAYLLTAPQVVLDGLQTGIGQLDEEQSFIFARPRLGHEAVVVLVRRQTILYTSSESGHRGVSSSLTVVPVSLYVGRDVSSDGRFTRVYTSKGIFVGFPFSPRPTNRLGGKSGTDGGENRRKKKNYLLQTNNHIGNGDGRVRIMCILYSD